LNSFFQVALCLPSWAARQVPVFLCEGVRAREKVRVLCTQPRRIAATSLARRVAKQQNKVLARSVPGIWS
jgi:HrpA-like RNA helicase